MQSIMLNFVSGSMLIICVKRPKICNSCKFS